MPYKQIKECDLCKKHDEECYEFMKVIVKMPRTLTQHEPDYTFHHFLICINCQQNKNIAELRALWDSKQ